MRPEEFDRSYRVMQTAFHRALAETSRQAVEEPMSPRQNAFLDALREFMAGVDERQWVVVKWASVNGWPEVDVARRYAIPV